MSSELTNLRNVAKTLGKSYVKIGIQRNSPANNYAAGHEFGIITKRVPKRSFLKDPLEAYQMKIFKEAEKDIAFSISKGETDKNKLLGNLGVQAVKISKEWVKSEGEGSWKPLSTNYKIRPSGKLVHSSSKILQDTGELMTNITFEVV